MIQKDTIFKPILCDILSHMPLMTLDLISTSTVGKDFVYNCQKFTLKVSTAFNKKYLIGTKVS